MTYASAPLVLRSARPASRSSRYALRSAAACRAAVERTATKPPPRIMKTSPAAAQSESRAPMRQSWRHSRTRMPSRNAPLPTTWTTKRAKKSAMAETSPSMRSISSPGLWSAWNEASRSSTWRVRSARKAVVVRQPRFSATYVSGPPAGGMPLMLAHRGVHAPRRPQMTGKHDHRQGHREQLVGGQSQQAVAHDVDAERQVVATTVHGRGEQCAMDRIANRQDHACIQRQNHGHQGADHDRGRTPSVAAQQAPRQSGAQEHAQADERQAQAGVTQPVDDPGWCAWFGGSLELVQQVYPEPATIGQHKGEDHQHAPSEQRLNQGSGTINKWLADHHWTSPGATAAAG